jgi:hypothetical protein
MITETSGLSVLGMDSESDKIEGRESGWRVSRQTVAVASRLASIG